MHGLLSFTPASHNSYLRQTEREKKLYTFFDLTNEQSAGMVANKKATITLETVRKLWGTYSPLGMELTAASMMSASAVCTHCYRVRTHIHCYRKQL